MTKPEALDPSAAQPHAQILADPHCGEDLVVQILDSIAPWAGIRTPALSPPAQSPTKEDKACPCPPRLLAEAELVRALQELARSNRDLEQFAFVASHDLQEPLRMVATYTQLLAERYRGKLDPDADRYIGYATEGALRMQTLIEDLLAYSRVGRNELPCQQVSSLLALEEALRNLSHTIAESGTVTHCGSLPAVAAERTQLTQLFQNLIANAIKFRRGEPPVISVQAERAGPSWLFSVSDNGVGIAPEDAGEIFILFRRLHTRSEYAGNGIGLAICQRIVERFGGRIWVESRLGEGSTFKFTLPGAVAEPAKGARP